MAERVGPGKAGCPNCGAEVRPGDAFCASCGKPLDAVDSDKAVHGPTQAGPEVGGSKSGSGARDTGVSPSGGRPVQTGQGGGRSWSEALRGRVRWFEELPMASKALLVGLAILVALPLLALLIPLALVASPLLFGVSLIGLIVQVGQRKPTKGWGLVAVVSLTFAVAFGGLSYAFYGRGAQGGTEGDPATGSVFEDYANASCLDEIRPDMSPSRYEVVARKTHEDESEAKNASLVVGLNPRGNPWAAIEELRKETAGYASVSIATYPPNLARYDRTRDKIVPGPLAPPDFVMRWHIVNSAAGEASLEFPKGELNACGSSYESGGYMWGVPE